MNIVYLIGNGFDLAQNLETKYSQFYTNHLLKLKTNTGILTKMIESIKDDVKSWADLEKRLGEFTTEMASVQDVDDVYDFLKRELKSYLSEEQKKFTTSALTAMKFHQSLTVPEACLQLESADAIKAHINALSSSGKSCSVSVISFNYTDVFERAIAYKGKAIDLGKREDGITVKLNTVYKVHGALSREMVLGVADANQVSNKQLASDLDALDVLVKPRTTALRKDYVCAQCANLIKLADIIVLYGLSIGETDKNWWKLITDRLATAPNSRLIIYSHLDDTIDPYDYPRIGRTERAVYKRLYECNGETNIHFTRMDKQIFISFDDSLFHA